MQPSDPIISVVIPTCNRAELLAPLADALGRQDGIGPYEVLFVDDASSDATPDVLQKIGARSSGPTAFRVLRNEVNGGPARARNLGWRAARAPLVAFLDDDCLPSYRWLAELSAALERADVAQGLVEVDRDEALRRGPFGRILVITEFSWKFETCNVGYRRDVLEALGGFDETFPIPFGEDTDLGWRALGSGFSTAWAPKAEVLHRVERSDSRVRDWLNWLRYATRCEFSALVVKRNPGLRNHLFGQFFYKPYHAYALGVVVSVALARRRPAMAAVMAAPWLRYRLLVDPHPVRPRWLWAVLPMAFAADMVETAATIKGALRYRVVLI